MKTITLIAFIILTGCASGPSRYANPLLVDYQAVEAEVKADLRLYPADVEYTVHVVADVEEVRELFEEKTGVFAPNAMAFFFRAEHLLVFPAETTIEIIRHEIAHAIVDAYFKMPVPKWLHEAIAEEAER